MNGRRFLCGAIIDKDGGLLIIDKTIDEKAVWNYHLGWPDSEEIEEAKASGKRFAVMEVREAAAENPSPRPSPDIEALLEKVRALPPMTSAQLRKQRHSFVRGQMGLTHPEMSREQIDAILQEIDPDPEVIK